MKVFVTGANGQLGHDVLCELKDRGFEAIGSDLIKNSDDGSDLVVLDITKKTDVENVLAEVHPDVIIHCAAWTNVDGAEDEKNKPIVKKVNVEGTRNLAEVAKTLDAKMVYISTDYVFNGLGDKPWQPDDKDFGPQNYYGETKLGGELAVSSIIEKFFIVRIAWVFGKNGKNFVDTMIKVGKKYPEVRVVNDQIGTPTYCPDLARLLVDMIMTEKYGFYHATNEGGYISWADFAKEIFLQSHTDVEVVPVTTEEYGNSIATRPKNSRLDKTRLVENGFTPLPDWRDALKRYLKEIE